MRHEERNGTAMWTLTGFADEIDPELGLQLETLVSLGIRHLELRAVWETNVVRLTRQQLLAARGQLGQAGVRVSSIGSPIGKVALDAPFEPHLEEFRRALDAAAFFDAPYVRMFSFFIPKGDDPDRHRGPVLERLGRLVRLAEEHGRTLLHENEKHIYGDVPQRCLDLLRAFESPRLRAAWDPANFVQCGVTPFADGYAALRPYIAYVHVKDALRAGGQVVPAGAGDGQWPETLDALQADGFDGFFSMEPHLRHAGAFAGFSGPDRFREATGAFQALLRERNLSWA